MRASGERSSCDALASSRRCACSSASCRVTRVSIRSAARLKLRASWATSSRPCTSTRACRLPAACASTERCSVSSRRVIRRDTGHAASATARNSIGRATGPPIHGRGGMGRQVRISSVRSSGNATRCTTPVMPRPPRRGKSPLCRFHRQRLRWRRRWHPVSRLCRMCAFLARLFRARLFRV